jgi:hypothetical protein
MKKITFLFLLTIQFSMGQAVAPYFQDYNAVCAGCDNSAVVENWNQYRFGADTSDGDIWNGWSLNPGLAQGSDAYTLYHDDDETSAGTGVDDWFVLHLDCTQLTDPLFTYTEFQTFASSWYDFHGVYYSEDYNPDNGEGSGQPNGTWVELIQGYAPSTPTERSFSLPTSTTAIAFRYTGEYADNWFIDDIGISEGGSVSCPQPNITAWNMGSDSVSFDGNNNSSVTSYQVEYSTANFTPGDGTATLYEFDSFPHTMTGLNSDTTYYFAMRSVCGDDYSDYIGNPDPWTTSSCPDSYSLPYLNDFNDTVAWTTCQYFYDSDGDGNYWFYVDYDDDGDYHAASQSWSGTPLFPDNWVIMGPIDLTNHTDALLEWKVRGTDSSWCQENYTVYVGVYPTVNNLLSSSSISYNETIASGGDACGETFADRSFDISAKTGGLVYIGFRHHDVTDMFTLNIDDVSVTSSTMSIEELTLDNIDYIFNQETKILNVNSQEILSNIQIHNILGQQVLNENLNNKSINIDLSTISSGVYIVNVEGNNSKTKTFKLAIK